MWAGPGEDWALFSEDYQCTSFGANFKVMTVDLDAGTAEGLGADRLVGVENVRGGWGDDELRGDEERNRLVGHRGNDSLYGRDGDDLLRGHDHDDFLDGGAGDNHNNGEGGIDTCVNPSPDEGAERCEA